MMRRNFLGGVFAATFLLGLPGVAVTGSLAADESKKGPVVVELYTSQGCNTCPPADAFLGELAKRKDVIALSFHVDYWDYIGWKDPYATKASTRRQRAYRHAMRRSYVYTPQMIIGGKTHQVGSNRHRINRDIAYILMDRKVDLPISLARARDGAMTASIGGGAPAKGAEIWMFLFDKAHTTKITRGENNGKRLTYHNVVREIRKVGTYDGAETKLKLSTKGADGKPRYGAAIVVQNPRHGPILGAAMAKLD